MIDLVNIQFAQGNNMNNFAPMNDYLKWAKQMIAKYGGTLSNRMLTNEDIVSNIATAMMFADWKWDSRGTQEGYRKQYAIWAIYKLRRRLYKQRHKICSPLPDNIAITDKHLNEFKLIVDHLLNNEALNTTQKKYITSYYLHGTTLQAIGIEHGHTRERVRQIISTGLKTLRKLYGNTAINEIG